MAFTSGGIAFSNWLSLWYARESSTCACALFGLAATFFCASVIDAAVFEPLLRIRSPRPLGRLEPTPKMTKPTPNTSARKTNIHFA